MGRWPSPHARGSREGKSGAAASLHLGLWLLGQFADDSDEGAILIF